MEKEQKKLKISILDKDFSIIVEDEEIGKEAARYVDFLMKEMYKEGDNQSFQQIALLCALNISYELFLERKKVIKEPDKIEEKIKKIKLLLSSNNDNPSSI